jgi:hypothetical protein
MKYVGGATMPDGSATWQEARARILNHCGIESKKELDTNPEAARLFLGLRHEYLRWVRDGWAK